MNVSLWHFLSQLPFSFDAQVFYAMMLAGTLGMLANWAVRWSRGELPCFMTYFVRTEGKRSVLSFLTLTGTAMTAVMAGVYMTEISVMGEAAACAGIVSDKQFVGWLNVLWTGAGTGFAIDATVNKGNREVWSEDKRTQRV